MKPIKISKKMVVIVLILIIGTTLIGYMALRYAIKYNELKNEEIQKAEALEEYDYEIKSTNDNLIEKDGIEVERLRINELNDQLEVSTTLKNNTLKNIKGFMIDIELLDSDGNSIAVISKNSTETIKKGQKLEIINYVIGLENQNRVSNARITNLEKNK